MANFQNVMNDIQSFGEMTSLAAQMAQAKQAREAAESSPAKELVQALTSVVRPAAAAAPNDTRLEGTVKRLAEFALPGSGQHGDSSSSDPEVKRLRADLDALSSRVDAQSKDISEIKNTSAESQAACMETKHMMAKLLDKFESVRPSGNDRGGGAAPAAAAEPGEAVPFFQRQVTVIVHTGAAAMLGVSGNAQYKSMKADFPKEGIPFATWWEAVSKVKSLDQWRKKVVNLGGDSNAIQQMDKPAVGVHLFRFLTPDGEISEDPLQPAPPAV